MFETPLEWQCKEQMKDSLDSSIVADIFLSWYHALLYYRFIQRNISRLFWIVVFCTLLGAFFIVRDELNNSYLCASVLFSMFLFITPGLSYYRDLNIKKRFPNPAFRGGLNVLLNKKRFIGRMAIILLPL